MSERTSTVEARGGEICFPLLRKQRARNARRSYTAACTHRNVEETSTSCLSLALFPPSPPLVDLNDPFFLVREKKEERETKHNIQNEEQKFLIWWQNPPRWSFAPSFHHERRSFLSEMRAKRDKLQLRTRWNIIAIASSSPCCFCITSTRWVVSRPLKLKKRLTVDSVRIKNAEYCNQWQDQW